MSPGRPMQECKVSQIPVRSDRPLTSGIDRSVGPRVFSQSRLDVRGGSELGSRPTRSTVFVWVFGTFT